MAKILVALFIAVVASAAHALPNNSELEEMKQARKECMDSIDTVFQNIYDAHASAKCITQADRFGIIQNIATDIDKLKNMYRRMLNSNESTSDPNSIEFMELFDKCESLVSEGEEVERYFKEFCKRPIWD